MKKTKQFEENAFRRLTFALGIMDVDTYDIPTLMNLATKHIQNLTYIIQQLQKNQMQNPPLGNTLDTFLTQQNNKVPEGKTIKGFSFN